jgi:rhodanese-related sulfurtransferase
MNRLPDQPTLRQAACLLLASVGLGLAGNALHPAGLRWEEENAGSGSDQHQAAGQAGVYSNETLYENQTVPAKPAPRDGQAARAIGAPTLLSLGTPATAALRSTWAEVKPLVQSGQMVLVDARPRTAFDAGHIPGAVSLPFKNLEAEIKSFMARHPTTTPLAIYCANTSCGTSSQMARALTQTYQYQDVRYLPGGYQEWRTAEGK